MILELSSNGVPVTGRTRTSVEALKEECMINFRVHPDDSYIKASSFIKISWIRMVKNSIRLIDDESMNRYVRLHIMELFDPAAQLAISHHRHSLPTSLSPLRVTNPHLLPYTHGLTFTLNLSFLYCVTHPHPPKPMLVISSMGHEEEDEAGHDQDPAREEQEDVVLEVDEHGEEILDNNKTTS
ncbi:hypothetical protein PIB30_081831 [Stylosanthes scabra]|uniref:Uncharacterized protein n=1 Tax=Stylosanthes scabra TaxID=79078 RepID=A0ABU6QSP3_9FABA|nr:hypothetical protein [Stylosanthes scabra]